MRIIRKFFTSVFVVLWSVVANASIDTDTVFGDPSSPVTIVEYLSMSCPMCKSAYDDLLPKIFIKYVNTGKVKVIFRHYPMKANDLKASAAALCVSPEQRKKMLDVLFATQKNWSVESSNKSETLEHLLRLGGISGDQAKRCLEDKELEEQLIKTREQAQNEMKVDAVPAFIINGKLYSGLISIETVDKALSN